MRLSLYADGAGAERVGRPGGWAFVLVRGDELMLERWGREEKTTSLAMELISATRGLEAVRELGVREVELISDCRIVLDVVRGEFLPKPVGVRGLAEQLRDVALSLRVMTKWVRAHAGDAWNEAVDALAADARGPLR
ncbi:MAG: ribonuclease HI [Archangium sp.]